MFVGAGAIRFPTSLTRIASTDKLGDQVMSAYHKADGNILLGCEDGVKLFNKETMSVTTYDTVFKQVTSVVEYRNNIYILHRVGDICKVEMCLPDMKSSYKLFEFKRDRPVAASMTVSDKYIVVMNPDNDKQLIIYDIISKEKKYRQPDVRVSPYFLPDGQLLVRMDDRIAKYRPSDEELTIIQEGLKNVLHMCTDEDGLIYASTIENQRVLYIISPDGKFLV